MCAARTCRERESCTFRSARRMRSKPAEESMRLRSVAPVAFVLASACAWSSGNPPLVASPPADSPATALPPVAWSARVEPATAEVRRLETLRAAARSHRAASPALREAESVACFGLSPDDRDLSPFFYDRDVVDAEPLRAPGAPYPGRLQGAVVTFRRVEGLTARRLQRLVDCQAARDRALQYSAPETTWCPLAVRGVMAHVALGERGLQVRLESDDPDAAAETFMRAEALLEPR
jgi:hypothetical protein